MHRNVVDRHSYFFSFQTSPDGNVTLSILNYVPTIRDAGKYMACRAENPELPDATLEDGWKLEIYCKLGKHKIVICCPNFVQVVGKGRDQKIIFLQGETETSKHV